MKILYVATLSNTINAFLIPHIELLLDQGHHVDVACNVDREISSKLTKRGCKVYNIEFQRSPIKKQNYIAYKKLKAIVCKGEYDLVHTHTPVASTCVRLACRNMKNVKVFYTAHGFHFYQGAPKKNWLIFYTAEWICAHWTDVLITINYEDYALAKRKMKAKQVEYVPGVGINLRIFGDLNVIREEKRNDLSIPSDGKLLLSVGELNANKNHEIVIRAIARMDNVYYFIAGKGGLNNYLQKIIEDLSIGDRVKLLGFRTDVRELYCAADALVFPSYREGLSVALMEAMASSLPVACSKIRGNTDLIDENGGTLFNPHSIDSCKDAIETLLAHDLTAHGKYNREKIKKFSTEAVLIKLKKIYDEVEK